MNQRHTSFVIEAEGEEGIRLAQTWAEKELGMHVQGNPDVVVLRYGLFSVADARKVTELATGAPFAGESKVVIIATDRAYHEAQNALLKVFEEPPTGTYLFLIMPSLGGLLPTLRSRVQVLSNEKNTKPVVPEITHEFLKGTKENRSAIIKKLTSGSDEEKRRLMREEAIALIHGIERVAYAIEKRDDSVVALLSDIAALRMHLYDRSAPVRMILEHLSLVTPNNLV